eukprot:CAMPEP_0172450816 /NCGR_PEP_ID=MMETSP1065-20121228/9039_1 /TAXON_ID=265537 /ORGANISM="Amphiprora paludosa, Strain CCMP125" /LENGTH=518 /DNA_ID=CAMNT_0013202653 /DNA_START=222 /DNA_END=1778 /DNA_ORIENTATION=-
MFRFSAVGLISLMAVTPFVGAFFASPTVTRSTFLSMSLGSESWEKAQPLVDYVNSQAPKYAELIKNGKLDQEISKIDMTGVDTLKKNIMSLNPEKFDEMFSSPLFSLNNQLTASWADFLASLTAVKSTMQQSQFSPQDITTALDLKSTSGWYFGAAVLLLGIHSASEDNQATTAPVGVDALMSAAASPKRAPLSLKETIEMLQNTAEVVNSELKDIKAEKATVDYEFATLKSELRDVQNKLDLSANHERELHKSLEATKAQLSKETKSLRLKVEKGSKVEEKLRKQLDQVEQKLAKQRVALARVTKKTNKEVGVEQKKSKQLAAEKADIAAEILILLEQVQSLRLQQNEEEARRDALIAPAMKKERELVLNGGGGTAVLEKPPVRATARPKPRATKPKATTGSSQRAASVKSNAQLVDLSNAFFADIAEPTKPVSKSPAAPTKTSPSAAKSKQMAKPIKNKAAVAAKGDGDWSHLSISTLKRKTVKDLTAYLESKGAHTTSPDGKILKKDALVELVLN